MASQEAGTTAQEKTTGYVDKSDEHIENGEQKSEAPDLAFGKMVLITVALCLAIFFMSLDNTIITTAIPRITDDFKAINDIGWYGSAYLFTTCAFQLFFGRLYSFFGVKFVYLSAILLFEVGSVICGAAPNSKVLIAGRAIAGVGSAGIFSGSFLITALIVPLRQRPIYIGIVGSMYGFASIAGPLIGGLLVDKASWRWCFYINLPLGGISALLIIFCLGQVGAKSGKRQSWREILWQLDFGGLATLIPSVISLLLAFQWGGIVYPWSSWRIILLLTMSGVFLVAFAIIQFCMGNDAMLPGHVIKQRTVLGATLFAMSLGASFFSLIYAVPVWFQAVQGRTAMRSGVMSLPLLLAMIFISVLSGAAVTTFGYYRPFCVLAAIFMSVGAGLCTTWSVDTPAAKWIGYQIIYGVGVGFGFQQPVVAVQTVLPEELVPVGTAIVIFAQSLGGALFINVSQNVFTNQLVRGLIKVIPGMTRQGILSMGAVSVKSLIPVEYRLAAQLAYNEAVSRTFYVSAGAACAVIIGAFVLEGRSVKAVNSK